MSLFDSIKYPVTDICDMAQMRDIPNKIVHPWLCECYFRLYGETLRDRSIPDWDPSVVMLWMITKHVDGRENGDEIVTMIKKRFLYTLKKRIQEYES